MLKTFTRSLYARTGTLMLMAIMLMSGYAIGQTLSISGQSQSISDCAVIHPVDDTVINRAALYQPKMEWAHEPTADWYHVYVTADDEGVLLDAWYPANTICAYGQCTSPDELWTPTNGQYSWWLGYWNEALGTNYSHTYRQMTFTVNMPGVGQLQALHPADGFMLPESEASLQWRADPGALWYEVFVSTADNNTPLIEEWYNAGALCEDGTCTLPLMLPANDYTWWMRAWGPAGMSEWALLSTFTVAGSEQTPTHTARTTATSSPRPTPTLVPMSPSGSPND